MKEMSEEEIIKSGIETKHTIMENGEKRFRLICSKDKTAYIRTEGGNNGYWQNSHFHKNIKEIYIVQKGCILFAKYINNKIEIKKLKEGEICRTEPNIPHNVYMYPNTVVHTVKYGKVEDYDWNAFEKLDNFLKTKSIEEIEELNKNVESINIL